MALSLNRVKTRLSFTEIAALLSGQRMNGADMGYQISDELVEWREHVVQAVEKGELRGQIEEGHSPPEKGYECFFPDGPWGTAELPYVGDWLHGLGYSKEEIQAIIPSHSGTNPDKPRAGSKASDQQQDKPLHPKRKRTFLTMVEGLSLEAMSGEIPEEPYKAAAIIQRILERHGLNLDKEPIADIIREIQASREDRESG